MTIANAIKRFTVTEYDRLTELGFFPASERVELLRGEIVCMAAKGTKHAATSRRLLKILPGLVGDRAILQSQDPIVIPNNSEPEPDFAILRNRPDNYLSTHPKPEDVLLLIEISDSSLSYDRDVKLSLYAEAKISDYWIFNLLDDCLEAYSEPYQNLQRKYGYRAKRVVLANEAIALPCFLDLSLDLTEIFPPRLSQ